MLFVAIGQLKSLPSVDAWSPQQEIRNPPPGVTVLGVYWTMSSTTQVVMIVDAVNGFDLRCAVRDWEKHVDFTISPAVNAWSDVIAREAFGERQVLARAPSSVEQAAEEHRATRDNVLLLGASRRSQSRSGPTATEMARNAAWTQHEATCHNGSWLTRREREILLLVSEGRSNREIASTLFISIRTVERHCANLYRKLGIHSRAEAVAWCYRNGIVAQTA